MSVFPAPDYVDGQRVSTWDAITYAIAQQTVTVGAWSSAVVPVSGWGYALVFFAPDSLQHQLLLQWYADAAGSNGVGGRQINYDSATLNHLQVCYRHLGPYLKATVTPSNLGVNYNPDLRVMMSNRVVPLPSLLDGATVDHAEPFTIAAGGNRTFVASYWGGSPIGCYVNGGSQGVTVEQRFLDATYNYRRITQYQVAANVDDYRIVVWPLNSIQIVLTNLSGAAACNNVQYSFVSSVSGSS